MEKSICHTAEEFDACIARLLRRFVYVNHTNIATFAEATAGYLKVREIPRDPFHLLPLLGMWIKRSPLSRASRAIWVRTGNRYILHYSQYEARASARFSLWHEFFEIMAANDAFPSVLTAFWRERLADRFAAAFLMPADALKREAEKFATNGEGLVVILADRFGTSASALRRRLREVAPRRKRFVRPTRARRYLPVR